ncbi:hypothetical protein BDW59DRAFT_179248 [Aspergillus cavernicola]|uniref:FAD-binding domain-containing protein n=1 Tax=Aspergillus cavernicola TaxID=176166 RepID=A0ABR4IGZ3_9EURO
MASSNPRIAIIGGGPAGLVLGLLLHKHDIAFTIFELRQKPTDEELARPSGMLDLHEESGLAALRECGLYNHFLNHTGECSEAQKVADKDGNIIYEDEGELSQRPEISRHALTSLLASNLPANSIKYEHKLLSVSTNNNNNNNTPETELDFGPHGKHAFDLVIGADGAWSRVRGALTDTNPHYTGMQSITATIPNLTAKYPHLSSLIGQGSFSALGFRHGVMSQRGSSDSARIYIFLSLADENFPSTSGLDFETGKHRLLTDKSLLGSFGEPIKDLVSVACDEEFASTESESLPIKPLYTLPPKTSFPHSPNALITVIGDAAHLMPPWAGEGVNLAMWDSLLLSRAIIKAFQQSQSQDRASFRTNLDPLLRDFEAEMFARAGEKAEETEGNGRMLFGEDGARAFKEFFDSFYGAGND